MHLKALIYGFLAGAVLVFVSALGLAIGFIEFIRPILSPGTELLRGHVDNAPFNPLVLGVVLNGVIFALLFWLVAAARRITARGTRTLALGAIIIGFLLITGMVFDAIALFTTGDPSWLLHLGA